MPKIRPAKKKKKDQFYIHILECSACTPRNFCVIVSDSAGMVKSAGRFETYPDATVAAQLITAAIQDDGTTLPFTLDELFVALTGKPYDEKGTNTVETLGDGERL